MLRHTTLARLISIPCTARTSASGSVELNEVAPLAVGPHELLVSGKESGGTTASMWRQRLPGR